MIWVKIIMENYFSFIVFRVIVDERVNCLESLVDFGE